MFPFQVQNLSGGELQRVALTLCLGKVHPYSICMCNRMGPKAIKD